MDGEAQVQRGFLRKVLSSERRRKLMAAAILVVGLSSPIKPALANGGLEPGLEAHIVWELPVETPEKTKSLWEIYKRPEINPYSDIILEVFGDNAANMEQILRWGTPGTGKVHGIDYGGENLSFDPEAVNYNRNGSVDRGLFMINSDTFANYMRKMGDELAKLGITSFDDMFEPRKNALMARVILENQGYGAWYGRPTHLSYNWVISEMPPIKVSEKPVLSANETRFAAEVE